MSARPEYQGAELLLKVYISAGEVSIEAALLMGLAKFRWIHLGEGQEAIAALLVPGTVAKMTNLVTF